MLALDRMPRSTERLRYLHQEVERLRGEHQVLLKRIQDGFDPEFDPDQPIPPITFQAVRELLPTDVPTAIVQYSLTQGAWAGAGDHPR